MDKKLKDKWVKALRSGEYKQAQDYLKGELFNEENESEGVGYCCLGVLCEITPGIEFDNSRGRYVIKGDLTEIFAEKWDSDGGGWEPIGWRDVDEPDLSTVVLTDEELPGPLYKLFGMDRKVRYQNKNTTVHAKLIAMNDAGKDFNKIADYIEKVL